MIIHCSRTLASKLPEVSADSQGETSPLGSWHGHLFTLDRRQCVIFCHDASRYCLFIPGMRKEHFTELGGKGFRQLYLATLDAIGCPHAQIKKVELALGPIRFDTATDRSVQSSINTARRDLEVWTYRVPNVMDLDPLAVSRRLNERPATVRRQFLWPHKLMREKVAGLG